ncbi:MAG TPA: hypothetical protein VEU51_10245, partial [Candidatus Acidoferrales bacterium]|nr:hypothetical protein [Candidatus Acidoferrales bacterium]
MSPIRRSFALAKVLCVAVAAVAMFFVLPTTVGTKYLTTGEANATPPDGNPNGNDPCNHLPDPPGKAVGHDKKCGVKGSSGGVAKGDFNGDGIGDLAIGIPDEDLSGQTDAGAVVVIYGSAASGLIPAGAAGVPASQFWTQDSPGILDIAEAGDHFGAALAAGDFNHDGFSDLAIGVPGEDTSAGTDAGAVNIIYGSA